MQTRKHRTPSTLSTLSTLSPAPTPPQTPKGAAALQAPDPTPAGEPPAVQAHSGGSPAGAPHGAPACTAGGSPARGGAGSGPGATARRPRLNVTEAERLCYSRRKLEAISALRQMGVDPAIFGLHKDYRVPGKRGRVYLVQHPTGTIYAFSSLSRIRRYVAESQAWKAHAYRTWDEWRKAAPMSKPERVPCSWEECPYEAAGMLKGRLLCRAHVMLVEQLLVARGRRAP